MTKDFFSFITIENKKAKWTAYFFLAGISFLLYFNSIYNGYCLDDVMVITQNSNTLKGFGGIWDHLTHDYLYGFFKYPSGSAASPWRPIPLITYSLEIGFFGKNHPEYSHLINVLLYVGCVLLLFYLLSTFLLKEFWISFFATLLFAIHPIHSEVVVNIKSRDEILCLLFMLSSLCFLFKYFLTNKKRDLLISLLCFFLSLLSKENAITFLVGIPLMIYFFTAQSRNQIIKNSIWFVGVVVLYFILRINIIPIVSTNPSETNGGLIIINYPFLYATGNEAFFTKIFILLKYLVLLVFPYPLCYDYSYNQIPYVNANEPMVWVSFLMYGSMIFFAIKTFKKKNIVAFCILLFLITFSLASNLFVDIAVTIGERLLFMPSVFFCIALAAVGNYVFSFLSLKYNVKKMLLSFLLIAPTVFACGFVIVNRNKDWKNMDTLNVADYPKAPNSIRVNDGVGNYYLGLSQKSGISKQTKDSLVRKAIVYYEKALSFFPEFDNDLSNLAVSYNILGDFDKAEYYWNRLREVSPENPKLGDKYLANVYLNRGINTNQTKNYDSSLIYLTKALKYALPQQDSVTANCYYHLAGMYYSTAKYKEAHDALGKLLELQPTNKAAQMGYKSCEDILKSTATPQ